MVVLNSVLHISLYQVATNRSHDTYQNVFCNQHRYINHLVHIRTKSCVSSPADRAGSEFLVQGSEYRSMRYVTSVRASFHFSLPTWQWHWTGRISRQFRGLAKETISSLRITSLSAVREFSSSSRSPVDLRVLRSAISAAKTTDSTAGHFILQWAIIGTV